VTIGTEKSRASNQLKTRLFAFWNKWGETITLAAVLAAALIARLHDIINADIWIDEANSILIAKSPVPILLEKLSLDANPPLYYFMLHYWTQLFGDSELAVRALSCIAGVCLTGAIYFVGKRLLTRGIGLWSAWIVALSPVQIFHSQQARMYSFLALFGLLSVSFLVSYLEEEKKRDQWLWVIFTVLALYTHNFALYLLPIEAVLIALSGKLFRKSVSWIISGAAIALIYSPWIPYLLLQLRSHDNYAWFIGMWKDWGPALILKRTCQAFSPGGEFILFTDLGKLKMWKGWPALISWILTIPGLFLAFRLREKSSLARSLWLPVYLVVPVVCSFLSLRWVTPHFVPSRVDHLLFPAFALLLAAGIISLKFKALRVAAAIALAFVSLRTISSFYPAYMGEQKYQILRGFGLDGTDRDLARTIARRLKREDVILCTALSRASLEYYLGHYGHPAKLYSFPRDTARHLGIQNDARLLSDIPALKQEAGASFQDALAGAGLHGRMFLVLDISQNVNIPLYQNLKASVYPVMPVEQLGRFLQIGTGDVIQLEMIQILKKM
jgi:hypothetical protein